MVMTLFLSGCEDGDQTTVGGDGNIERQSQCWQTKIIQIVLSKVDDILETSSNNVVSGGASVIALGFSVWMAFRLLKILPSFKEENLGEILTEIGQKLFLCGFCAYIISDPQEILNAIQLFLVPIYNTILELGAKALDATKNVTVIDLGVMGQVKFAGSWDGSSCSTDTMLQSSAIKNSIVPMASCLSCTISERLNAGVHIAIKVMTTGNLAAILVGLVILAIFTAAKFGFVFFVVDALFRINFAVVLLPVLIMGIPFAYTRKWSKHGILMFLNSAGVLMFIGVLVSITVGALEYILQTLAASGKFEDDSNITGLGPVLLSLFLIATLLINIPGFGVALANKFIGGGNGQEFLKKISKFVFDTAKRAGAKVLSAVTQGATEKLTNALEKYEVTREAKQSLKNAKQRISDKLNDMAGYNED